MDFDYHNPLTCTKLARAIRAKNIAEVKRLLNKGLSPDVPDNRGYTTLHEASKSNDMLDIAKLLIESGAYIEHKTVDGETPLYLATTFSSEKIVEFFLSCGCLVNNATIDNVTPLHVACTKRNDNILRMLLKAGANLNAKDNKMFTPLFYAIQFENASAVKILLEAGCDSGTVDYFNRSPLQFSCMIGNLEIFDLLIEHLGLSKELVNQQTSDGWTLLMEAVQFKNYNIAEKLISYGAETTLVDSRGLLALHLAAHCNRTDCLELIIRHTPKDVIERYATAKGNLTHTRSIPCLLIDKDMFDGLKLLFEYGVSNEILACPARMGDNLVSPVSFLLLHGSNIEADDKVKYLELLLSKEALKDPVYDIENLNTIRSVEAAVKAHKIDHVDCNCELLLSMLLNEGVDPDAPLDFRIPPPFILAMDTSFVRGLCLLLAHSNSVDPEQLLLFFIDRLSSPTYRSTSRDKLFMEFLVWASTDFKYAYTHIKDAVRLASDERAPSIRPMLEIVKAKALRVQPLKYLARLAIRKQILLSGLKLRNALKSIVLPTGLKEFLCYTDLLSYHV